MKNDVVTALQKKAAEVEAQADFITAQTNDWQTIKAYMNNRVNDIELTPEQQKKLERYQFIYSEMSGGKSTDSQIVNQVTNFFGIKLSQAYEDMRCTREIFATVIDINKEFELSLALQLNKKYMAKAEAMGDMRSLAALEKNRAALLKLLPDKEENPADLFEGHVYEMVFDPRLIGAPKVDMKKVLAAINAKRSKPVKLDMFEELDFEDSPGDDSH